MQPLLVHACQLAVLRTPRCLLELLGYLLSYLRAWVHGSVSDRWLQVGPGAVEQTRKYTLHIVSRMTRALQFAELCECVLQCVKRVTKSGLKCPVLTVLLFNVHVQCVNVP